MSNLIIRLGKVERIETLNDGVNASGLRIKARLSTDKEDTELKDLRWYFPLMPKTFQSTPKIGECVLILYDEGDSKNGQGFYIGPVISQPQFQENCPYDKATSLLMYKQTEPIKSIDNDNSTTGSFPNASNGDVAVEGRGGEDIILKNNNSSEIDIRAGIRKEFNDSKNPELFGKILFNKEDPAYIQLKYKYGIATGEKKEANSIVNIVADRINIMSNKDNNVKDEIHDNNTLVKEDNVSKMMDNLHQVPMGDKLVELLKLMRGAIMHHVHPWAGMEQCGDWPGYIKKLDGYDIDSILSEYVRIS